jgi:hypothetical protein
VEAAALLHDVDKLQRVKPQVDGLAHGEGSAEWLARQGYPELGPAIIGHPVTLLADAAWFAHWIASASPEALIVSYADKRAGQRLESMTERFASWERHYPPAERAERARGIWDAEMLENVRHRADEIEHRACKLASVAPGDVCRLVWTRRAIGSARHAAAVAATAVAAAAVAEVAAPPAEATNAAAHHSTTASGSRR